MNALIDAAGQQFGFLVATEVDRHPRWKGKPRWRCRCICGNETFVVGNKLRSGETTSCGCDGKQIEPIAGEEWRVIPSIPLYEVASHGRVRRSKSAPRMRSTYPGRPIVPTLNANGYLYVSLRRDGKDVARGVHALVAEAFHGWRPSEDHEVAHGDGSRVNNHYRNLRWATRLENAADKMLHGTVRSGSRPMSDLADADVRKIRAFVVCGLWTLREAAEHYGVAYTIIHNIMRGKSRKTQASGFYILEESKRVFAALGIQVLPIQRDTGSRSLHP